MKEMGLRNVLKRKFVETTNSYYKLLVTKNELNRDLYSQRIGEKRVSDIICSI